MQYDVLCIGGACMDHYYFSEKHPKPDEKVRASSKMNAGGGPACNGAYASAVTDGKTALIAGLGKDAAGRQITEELSEEGVDCSACVSFDGSTSESVIIVKPNSDRAVVSYKNTDLNITDDISVNFPDSKVSLHDGHQASLSLRHLTENPNVISVIDAGSLHDGTKLLWDKVDWLVASRKFTRQFTGVDDNEKAFEALSERHEKVIVTLGADGVLWSVNGKKGRVSTYSVESIDSNGAGDVFHGAFALALAEGKNHQEAIAWASATAAVSTTFWTPRNKAFTRQAVEALMQEQELTYSNY